MRVDVSAFHTVTHGIVGSCPLKYHVDVAEAMECGLGCTCMESKQVRPFYWTPALVCRG